MRGKGRSLRCCDPCLNGRAAGVLILLIAGPARTGRWSVSVPMLLKSPVALEQRQVSMLLPRATA